jgi:hypothetical protein
MEESLFFYNQFGEELWDPKIFRVPEGKTDLGTSSLPGGKSFQNPSLLSNQLRAVHYDGSCPARGNRLSVSLDGRDSLAVAWGTLNRIGHYEP